MRYLDQIREVVREIGFVVDERPTVTYVDDPEELRRLYLASGGSVERSTKAKAWYAASTDGVYVGRFNFPEREQLVVVTAHELYHYLQYQCLVSDRVVDWWRAAEGKRSVWWEDFNAKMRPDKFAERLAFGSQMSILVHPSEVLADLFAAFVAEQMFPGLFSARLVEMSRGMISSLPRVA